jgi:hypothetical protein
MMSAAAKPIRYAGRAKLVASAMSFVAIAFARVTKNKPAH